ncbi:MAG: glutamate carboxypeptidase [Enterobacterales bacterium]|jgi:glutamate carboxypeptidase
MMKIQFLITAVFLGSSLFTGALSAQQTLTDTEKSIISDVDAAFEQQLSFLEKVVNISSGSRNLKGVRETGDAFMAEFGQLGFENRWIDMPKEMDRAGHMFSKKTFGSGGKKIMLIGHLDTVFPHDSPFQKFVRNGDKATGPGITDMKDGNVIILYALKALIEGGHLKQGAVSVFFTGDEESTGKPLSISRGELIEVAKANDIALNFESGSKGYAVIGRRGSSGWKLSVSGKRAHSAGVFSEYVGAGAIFEASRILNDFYNEVKGEHGLTFNPGVIAGGTFVTEGDAGANYSAFGKTNVVAQTVVVKGGLRFLSDEQLQGARAKMRAVVSRHLPQTDANIEFIDSYPAMTETTANRALLAKLSDVSVAMGMEPLKAYDPTKRGAADISFVAPHVTSMDALGGAGGGSHTPNEWADLVSIKQATERTAVFLYRLLNE